MKDYVIAFVVTFVLGGLIIGTVVIDNPDGRTLGIVYTIYIAVMFCPIVYIFNLVSFIVLRSALGGKDFSKRLVALIYAAPTLIATVGVLVFMVSSRIDFDYRMLVLPSFILFSGVPVYFFVIYPREIAGKSG